MPSVLRVRSPVKAFCVPVIHPFPPLSGLSREVGAFLLIGPAVNSTYVRSLAQALAPMVSDPAVAVHAARSSLVHEIPGELLPTIDAASHSI